jgi:homoserine kinase
MLMRRAAAAAAYCRVDTCPTPPIYTHPGAYGCTISGAGPTAVAVVPDPTVGAQVAAAMGAAFTAAGLQVNSSNIVRLDPEGAKFV